LSAVPDGALELWRVEPVQDTCASVFPDGCRDLIVHLPRRGRPACFVSALADGAERVPLRAGDRLAGVRLCAGAQFDEAALAGALACRDRFDDADLLAAVGDAVRVDARVREALDCLAAVARVDEACARLGVSARTLERLVCARTGRPPAFWKGLARARRCARAAPTAGSLAELAFEHGYADQAHMARELRRWFDATPTNLRAQPQRYAALAAPGFG